MAFRTYGEYRASMKAGGRGKQAVTLAEWNKRKLDPSIRPLSAAEITRQANANVKLELRPELDALRDERADAADQAAARLRSEQETNLALGPILRDVATGVADSYRQSAAGLSAIGRGLGDVANNAATTQAAALEASLAGAGAPTAGVQQATGAAGGIGDLLYGANAYIPATQIEREAGAYGAEAALLPGYESGRSLQRQAQIRGEANELRKTINEKIAQVEARRGPLTIKARQEIADFELEKFAAREQARSLGAQLTGVDPVTGKPTPETTETTTEETAAQAEWDKDKSLASGWVTTVGGKIVKDANGKKIPASRIWTTPNKPPKAAEGDVPPKKGSPAYVEAQAKAEEAIINEVVKEAKDTKPKPFVTASGRTLDGVWVGKNGERVYEESQAVQIGGLPPGVSLARARRQVRIYMPFLNKTAAEAIARAVLSANQVALPGAK